MDRRPIQTRSARNGRTWIRRLNYEKMLRSDGYHGSVASAFIAGNPGAGRTVRVKFSGWVDLVTRRRRRDRNGRSSMVSAQKRLHVYEEEERKITHFSETRRAVRLGLVPRHNGSRWREDHNAMMAWISLVCLSFAFLTGAVARRRRDLCKVNTFPELVQEWTTDRGV